jgi:adenine-specific DNA-methyltransferase
MIDKLNLESLDIAGDKINKLKGIFPEVFREGKIDFDALKTTLGDVVDESNEKYEMNWAGKKNCFRAIQSPSIATLKPVRDESVDFDNTENLYIEGDNLEVLKLLQKSYYGKVKMIYIDPPYNTGKDFVYPDNYKDNLKNYLELTGQVDSDGRKINNNVDTDGRYHSNWMNMIYPRLFLARNLLMDDGAIFISIDDNEAHNLKKLCDEIYGEENFLANIVWQKKYAATNDSKGFSTTHDYIMVYQKSDKFKRNLLPRTTQQNKPYKNDDGDGKGLWRSDNLLVRSFSKSGVYPIINPNTGKEYYPSKGNCWRASRETMSQWQSENRIYFGKDGTGAPQLKRYLNEVQQGRVPITWWPFEEVGHNDGANKEVQAIFDSKSPFDTPKPTTLIKQILKISTNDNDLCIDFFSGSSTTAHAVMQLNAENSESRKFIMVQLPEPTDEKSEAYKAGYKNICEIGKERIRRAGEKINEELRVKNEQLKIGEEKVEGKIDTGFRVLRLEKSNFKLWDGEEQQNLQQMLFNQVDNIDPNSTEEDILFEILLKAGIELDSRIDIVKLAGKKVYSLIEGLMLVCLEDNLTLEVMREMAEMQPVRVVCLDRGFNNNDALKTNAVQIMKAKEVEDFRTV